MDVFLADLTARFAVFFFVAFFFAAFFFTAGVFDVLAVFFALRAGAFFAAFFVVFFADGDPRTLGLSVYQGFGDTARVTANRRIEVTIQNESQIIPFRVSHPEDEDVSSYAFIRVPGFDDALPQVDRRAAPLVVNSEQETMALCEIHATLALSTFFPARRTSRPTAFLASVSRLSMGARSHRW